MSLCTNSAEEWTLWSSNIFQFTSTATLVKKPAALRPWANLPNPEQASMAVWRVSHVGTSWLKIFVKGPLVTKAIGNCCLRIPFKMVYFSCPSSINPEKWNSTSDPTNCSKRLSWPGSNTTILATRSIDSSLGVAAKSIRIGHCDNETIRSRSARAAAPLAGLNHHSCPKPPTSEKTNLGWMICVSNMTWTYVYITYTQYWCLSWNVDFLL